MFVMVVVVRGFGRSVCAMVGGIVHRRRDRRLAAHAQAMNGEK